MYQPLYLARNGISANGEDPTRTYLFRNFYAAEAQLGISDYKPTIVKNLLCALATNHDGKSFEQDFYIQPETPVLRIERFKLDTVVEAKLTSAGYLP